MATRLGTGVGVLFALVAAFAPVHADEPRDARGPDPELTLESAMSGDAWIQPLPAWSWRPRHDELVRWVTARGGEGAPRGRRLARRGIDGALADLVALGSVEAVVPARTGGSVAGIGRRGPPTHVFTDDGRGLLVVERGHLVWCSLDADPAGGPRPSPRLVARPDGPIADLCPSPDGGAIAFAHAHDLWLAPTDGGPPRARTSGGTSTRRRATLDWLYPEELGYDGAIWWSPDSSRIAFLEMDLRDVPTFDVPRFGGEYPRPEAMHYPKAGHPNPRVRVGVVVAADMSEPVWLDLGAPAPEYVVRVAWVPDSKRLLVVTLDRPQRKLTLHLVDALSGRSRVVREERSAAWIDPPPAPRFVDAETFLFRSASDEDPSWRVLRLRDDEVVDVERLTSPEDEVFAEPHYDPVSGAAAIVREPLGVRRPFVRDRRGEPWRAIDVGSGEADVHATFSPSGRLALLRVSSPRDPPVLRLREIAGSGRDEELGRAARPAFARFGLATPIDGEFDLPTACGELRRPGGALATVRWRLWRPAEGELDTPRPVVVDVYGGPGSQSVRGEWRRNAIWATFLARRGFLLLEADGRGSGGQGVAFQHAVRGALGLAEIDDQARAVRHVAERFPYVNGDRVGVFGWSYGGTMALLAMTRHPGVFRCAVSVAPVTDWRLYDSIYTERYMGMPDENAAGYDAASILRQIENLGGPVLVVHGLGDDNVHAQNTLHLVQAALAADKSSIESMLYPDVGHGLGGARPDMVRRQLAFFERHLR